ncbi:hypothetical protein Dda_0061 [Drechslerella dactyloides]|uniref:Uncharacterized protein n=1 Tax=Drechslerella dactyloides TaxID=74499 RepID=A0AAD6J3N7_DREDA|nr:hypothetical protein Dda_0061 [Drechslerella dactyloides]
MQPAMSSPRPRGTIRALYRKRYPLSEPPALPSRMPPPSPHSSPPGHPTHTQISQHVPIHYPMEATVTPEYLRILQKQHDRAVASGTHGILEPSTFRKKAPAKDAAVTGWEADIPSYSEIRAQLSDLAARALKKGYRQPMNFHESNEKCNDPDTWTRQAQIKRYMFSGVFAPADLDDPVQWVTNNEGMIRFELWYQVWSRIKQDYIKEAMLPDLRDVMLHEEVGKYLLSVLKNEIQSLQTEEARVNVYTGLQIKMLEGGIEEREMWIEEVSKCMAHLQTFQHIYAELPENAMLGKSGLVPPQQPSTPVNSERCPSPSDKILYGAANEQNSITIEHEKLIERLRTVRNCVSKLEKSTTTDVDEETKDATNQAAKIMLELINETNQLQNQISKALYDYSQFTNSLNFLKKERLEEFITRYNNILSVLLEVPSHIKFGLKTNILSQVPAAQAQWYRKDLERKLTKCEQIRAEIKAKVQGLEEGIEKAKGRPSDDSALATSKNIIDGSAYDTRPKRFNTARY